MTKEIDCRGLNCPQPVINTKKALDKINAGKITTIVDNDTARQNVTLFAKNAGYEVEEREENGNFYLTISKYTSIDARPADDKIDTPVLSANPVYLVSTNCFGQGSPDLGAVLMKSLMHTLTESDKIPQALVFLNTGVYLTCTGSEVLPYLQKLHKKGTSIISCGTCLDYYKLREKLEVGNISNMYEINNTLNSPGKVITIS